MTSDIMEEWLRALNGKMKQQKCNILLFLDSAVCHPRIEISNVQFAWFLPSTTSVFQPMDQGVVKCVKLNYRELLMQYLLANMGATASVTQLAKLMLESG
jgi:hypothetical protein